MPKKSKILLVDDDAAFTALLKERLEYEQYEIAVANSGEEALKKVDSFFPDLVLLDLKMPGLTGDFVALRIKAKTQDRLPIIVLTGYGDPITVTTTFAMGVSDHVVKPCDLEDLIHRIERCLMSPGSV